MTSGAASRQHPEQVRQTTKHASESIHTPFPAKQRKIKVPQPHMSKSCSPIDISNHAEVHFFWSLFTDMKPRTSKQFVQMAAQWNSVLTRQLSNPMFENVLLKNGKHLENFHKQTSKSYIKRESLKIAAWFQAKSADAGQPAAANTHEINEQIDQAVADVAGLRLWGTAAQQVTAAPSVEEFSSYMPLSSGQMSSSSGTLLPSSAAKRPAQQASMGFPVLQKSPNEKPKKVQKVAKEKTAPTGAGGRTLVQCCRPCQFHAWYHFRKDTRGKAKFSDFVQQQPHFIAMKEKDHSKNCPHMEGFNALAQKPPHDHSDAYPGWNRANWLDYLEKKKGRQPDKQAAMKKPRHT